MKRKKKPPHNSLYRLMFTQIFYTSPVGNRAGDAVSMRSAEAVRLQVPIVTRTRRDACVFENVVVSYSRARKTHAG